MRLTALPSPLGPPGATPEAADAPRLATLYNPGLRFLHECYVGNKTHLSRLIQSGVQGKERRYGGLDWQVNWWQADEGTRFHNRLEFQDFSQVSKEEVRNTMDEAAGAVLRHFRDRDEPFTWVVGPNPQPVLEDVLVANSLHRTQNQLVMYRACTREPEDEERFRAYDRVDHGIEVGPLTFEEVGSWVATWATGGPKSDVDHWTKIYKHALDSEPGKFHMFAARHGDEVVGTGFLHCWGSTASVHALYVKTGWRNRGVGRMLISFALSKGRECGQSILLLTAPRLAAPLFVRVGFTPFGAVAEYAWTPPSSAPWQRVSSPTRTGGLKRPAEGSVERRDSGIPYPPSGIGENATEARESWLQKVPLRSAV